MQFPDCGVLDCIFIPEHPESIRTKLCLVGINGLLCFVVDRGQRILLTLAAILRDGGNGHIVLVAQLLHSLFQLVCRESAHLHPASARNGAGEKVQV